MQLAPQPIVPVPPHLASITVRVTNQAGEVISPFKPLFDLQSQLEFVKPDVSEWLRKCADLAQRVIPHFQRRSDVDNRYAAPIVGSPLSQIPALSKRLELIGFTVTSVRNQIRIENRKSGFLAQMCFLRMPNGGLRPVLHIPGLGDYEPLTNFYNCVLNILDWVPPNMKDAATIVCELQKLLVGDKAQYEPMVVYGHSMGGALAQYAVSLNLHGPHPLLGIVTDSLMPGFGARVKMEKARQGKTAQVLHLIEDGDWVEHLINRFVAFSLSNFPDTRQRIYFPKGDHSSAAAIRPNWSSSTYW